MGPIFAGVPQVAGKFSVVGEETDVAEGADETSTNQTPLPRHLPGEVIWRAGFRHRLDSPGHDGHTLPESDRRNILHTLKQTEQVWTDLHNLLVEKGDEEEATRSHQCLDHFRLKAIWELPGALKGF